VRTGSAISLIVPIRTANASDFFLLPSDLRYWVSRGGSRSRLGTPLERMGSWQPRYVDLDPSQVRLAEMVLKL
jgi:hypothetical protein